MNEDNLVEGVRRYSLRHLAIAFVGGAAAGAAAVWLLTPQTGEDAREMISGLFRQGKGAVSRIPRAVEAAMDAAREELGTTEERPHRQQPHRDARHGTKATA